MDSKYTDNLVKVFIFSRYVFIMAKTHVLVFIKAYVSVRT